VEATRENCDRISPVCRYCFRDCEAWRAPLPSAIGVNANCQFYGTERETMKRGNVANTRRRARRRTAWNSWPHRAEPHNVAHRASRITPLSYNRPQIRRYIAQLTLTTAFQHKIIYTYIYIIKKKYISK